MGANAIVSGWTASAPATAAAIPAASRRAQRMGLSADGVGAPAADEEQDGDGDGGMGGDGVMTVTTVMAVVRGLIVSTLDNWTTVAMASLAVVVAVVVVVVVVVGGRLAVYRRVMVHRLDVVDVVVLLMLSWMGVIEEMCHGEG
mmetsp:Transcript_30951/g.65308  ORF Transcript_30951/g.65308 Transcript_30951/m.65308 type:complete len:144 (-) Transcript_30951:18-449(-)